MNLENSGSFKKNKGDVFDPLGIASKESSTGFNVPTANAKVNHLSNLPPPPVAKAKVVEIVDEWADDDWNFDDVEK